ncbi:MAG: hypothetical protein HXX08_23750 [Chloroflexi bacterium]|uniref:Uncharacterized protein n=1 Tax=Candidatus Chlorohelix allophototropha TaxID=3003348 RepID=A0A8T7MA33_9CHLR|nr:hypothetical protein [Chloroflexota bacterium]WJW68818.1 hypothetical protein OZ401_004436 [Chloroflexota bacterium L227-S17]
MNYRNSRAVELVVKGLIALITLVVLAQLFKGVFAIISALLTITIITVGLIVLLKALNNRRY